MSREPPPGGPVRGCMRYLVLLFYLSLPVFLLTGFSNAAKDAGPPCGHPGQWRVPGEPAPLDAKAILARLDNRRVVLLGEEHDNPADHRWQLHTLAALHGRDPRMAMGLEMFPRRVQPVLDDWVAGRLEEAEFLRRAEWDKVWGHDARLYLPLFHFARMHRVPMLALNVDRALVSRVEKLGWDGVPEAERQGLGRPAAASADYRAFLRQVYDQHPGPRSDEGFERFVQAQGVWDRAMAEAMATWLQAHPGHRVVAILGAGHVRHGYGVAHQLADLGVGPVAGLLTWDHAASCQHLGPGLADAVFLKSDDGPGVPPPRLGIAMVPDAQGVRIAQVVAGSVAEQAGLRAQDLLVQAAGRPVTEMAQVRAVIERQAPGTWLPLKVRRDGQELDLVARFPVDPRNGS